MIRRPHAALIVLALYVLTAPISEMLMARLLVRGWISVDSRNAIMPAIRGFYWPVHWLAMNAPWPIRSPLQWYYNLWLRLI
jgi:hypothetical protein